MMNFFVQNEWLLFLTVFVTVFVLGYRFLPRILNFVYLKTSSSQKEILQVIEKLGIQKDDRKTVTYLWALSLLMLLLPVIATLPNILVGISIGVVLFFVTWMMVRVVMQSIWEQYCSTLSNQLLDGMILMNNSMKAGLNVTQAMERVVDNIKGPLSKEFNLVLSKVKLGMNLNDSLNELMDRVDVPDVTIFVTSVNILRDTGGNLAETFSVLAETIRSRQKVQSKIKALTAQGMMQAKIIGAIPFVILGIMYFMQPEYTIILFTTALGWVALIFILILVIIGRYMMKKMATIEV